jgi:hypothetical protein
VTCIRCQTFVENGVMRSFSSAASPSQYFDCVSVISSGKDLWFLRARPCRFCSRGVQNWSWPETRHSISGTVQPATTRAPHRLNTLNLQLPLWRIERMHVRFLDLLIGISIPFFQLSTSLSPLVPLPCHTGKTLDYLGQRFSTRTLEESAFRDSSQHTIHRWSFFGWSSYLLRLQLE